MGKHITVKMWNDAEDFSKLAEPGDTVDEEIAMSFLESVPPAIQDIHYFQCGEPYQDAFDQETGKIRSTFTTFVFDTKAKKWVYAGNCFRGCSRDHTLTYEKMMEMYHKMSNSKQ